MIKLLHIFPENIGTLFFDILHLYYAAEFKASSNFHVHLVRFELFESGRPQCSDTV